MHFRSTQHNSSFDLPSLSYPMFFNSITSAFSNSHQSTKVILVCHGHTTYNEQNRFQGCSNESVLTEKGHQAAYQTGLALQQFTFDKIYTSPLTRVQQTTEAIINAFQQKSSNLPPVLIDEKLMEINLSIWQGLSKQDVKENFAQDYNCWQETPHLFNCIREHKDQISGSPYFPVLELFHQARQFWQELLANNQGQTILIVAHAGINRALISTAIGLSLKHYHSLQQSNCGISCLEFFSSNSNDGKLNWLNLTNHLGKNLPEIEENKYGWRWLLLSDKVTETLCGSTWIKDFFGQSLIDFVLTDNSERAEFLAINLLKNSQKTIHLPIAQDHFLEIWQQTIFARQKLNYCSLESSLVTGLIIVQDNLLSQILYKTLGINLSLDTTNNLSVLHYPQADQHSILQGLLPINSLAVNQLSAR